MPEFVVVTFPTRRRVFMDNQPMGHIGDPLIVQAGFHDFDLGSPADYAPTTQNVNVVNTAKEHPMAVAFAPIHPVVEVAAPAEVGGIEAPKAPAKRKAKAARKKAAKKAKKSAPKRKAAAKKASKKTTQKSAKKKAAKKK